MAFNSSDDIDIVIRVSADGAIRVLKQAGEEIEKIEGATKKAETGLTSFQGKIIAAESALNLLQKAGQLAGRAIAGIGDAIQKGSAINDVAESFKNLANSAGLASDVLIRDLRSAVAGTVSDFELMKRSAELARAGLDPKIFGELALAARTLADQVGGDTLQAFDQLANAMVRGRVIQLKDFGIIIDQKKAYEDFARQIGTTAEQLTELGQVQAGRLAIEQAIIDKNRELGAATIDSADSLDQMSSSLTNAWNEMISTVAANESLNEALSDLARWVSTIDFGPMIAAINAIITVASEAAIAIGKMATALEYVANIANTISGNAAPLLNQLGIAPDELLTAEGALKKYGISLDKTSQSVKEVAKEHGKVSGDFSKYISAAKSSSAETTKLEQAHKNLNKAIKAANGTDGIPELRARLREIIVDFKLGRTSAQQFADAINQIGKGASAGGLDTLAAELGSVFDEVDKSFKSIGEIFDPANIPKLKGEIEKSTNALSDFFNDTFGEELGSSLEGTFASAIGDSLSAAINGGDFKQIGKDLATDIGRDLGQYFGGDIGGEIGAALGEMVFDAFDHAFGGGRDPGAKARKSIDAWFAEIFNANRLTVIVNGELQKIKDLVFSASGDSSEFESGAFDDVFATLPASAMEAFNGVGAAYEALLEEMGINTEEISGQLAAILFNNIGGSISDLRLLIEATGQSAEAMADALIQAFLEGSMSALELARNLRGLEQAMQKGIPEGIGRIDIAWQRMVDAGFEGGRALFDAIQSIAIEAQELGASTMPELANIMISTFGIAADQVEIFMQAMAAAGINSLADLANASNATLAAIAGNMQAIQQGEPDRFKPVQISRPTSSFGGGGGGGRSVSRGPSEAQRAAEQKRDDKRDKFESLRDLVLGTDEYTQALERLAAGTISIIEINTTYNDLHEEALRLTNQLARAEEKAQKEIDKKGKVSAETARRIAELRAALETLGDVTEESNQTTGDFISINEELFDFLGQFKDDLNALQLAADLAGVSFKALQEEAVAAFRAGDLTATEALRRLNGGIDGQDASVVENFARVRQGAPGGILSIDALRDLAANIIEGGGDSFEDIVRPLVESGESIKNIQDLFIALANTGIDSLDELSKVSDEKAIEIFAELEGLGFSFDAVTDATIRLRDELNQIPTSKKVDIEINAVMDEETKRILEQLGLLEKITTRAYGKKTPGLKPPSVGPG